MSYVGMTGVLVGLSIAEVLRHRFPLNMPESKNQAMVRAGAGLTFLLGMFFGVRFVEKLFTPGSVTALSLRAVRYGQVPPLILIAAPLLFEALDV